MITLFYHAKITTMDNNNPIAEALVVSDGKLHYVGSLDGAKAILAGTKYRSVDLEGRRMVPGFIDAHAHLSLFSVEWNNLRLKPTTSIPQILQLVQEQVGKLTEPTWIRGSGYNHLSLQEKRHPTREELDRVAPHHPVVLTRTCGHIATANTVALKRAGIDLSSADPPGGRFGRNSDGTLNGVLYDQALARIQEAAVPDPEEWLSWLQEGARVWGQAGITGFHDAGGPPGYFRVLARAYRENRIAQRVDAMVWNGLGVDQLAQFLGAHLGTGFHAGNFYVGPAKIMMDGSSSGPTAATRQPYESDPQSCGILYRDADELRHWMAAAVQDGFQVTAHAVGDHAISIASDVIGQVGDPNLRNRIEHCAMCSQDLIQNLVRHAITPVAQPNFLYEFGDGYIDSYGWERGAYMFPLRSWLDAGLKVAGSSDSPVTDYHPMSGIASAISRKTRTGQTLASEERITLDEAIRLYTVNPAWLTFAETSIGQLKAGFRANLVVLEEDIYQMSDEEDIRNCPVSMTVVDGQWIWVSGHLKTNG